MRQSTSKLRRNSSKGGSSNPQNSAKQNLKASEFEEAEIIDL